MEEEEEKEVYNKIMSLAESTRIHASPSQNNSPVKYETVLVTDDGEKVSDVASIIASTTSSETTVVPSWNLSSKDGDERNIEVPLHNNFILSPPTPILSPPSALGARRRYHTLHENFFPAYISREPGLVFEEAMPYYFAPKDTEEEVVREDKENMSSEQNDSKKADPLQQVPRMVEEPPEETTSCNSALNLTPKQLAEIFLAFGQTTRQSKEETEEEGNQKEISPQSLTASSPLSVNSSTSEKSVCTPRVESLERECNAFKKIVKQDAQTIHNLQRVVETQKELCSLKEVEIVDKQTELQIAEERIARLKKEREEYFERETELMETIKILKQEIDKMTLKSGTSLDRIEIPRIETELLLVKSQLEEQKERVSELETNLKEKDKTNFDLQTKIDWLKSQQKVPFEEKSYLSSDVTCATDQLGDLLLVEDNSVSGPGIANVLQSFSKRLESLEKEKKGREEMFLREIKRNNAEMERIRNLLQDDSKEKDTVVQVSEDPEEIEAMPLDKEFIQGTRE